MTKRCSICHQPITNTPYHSDLGNRDRCQKHCSCTQCQPAEFAVKKDESDGPNPLLALAAAEIAADVFSSAPDTPSVDVSTPDTSSGGDFDGFGGGNSGGGGVSGSF